MKNEFYHSHINMKRGYNRPCYQKQNNATKFKGNQNNRYPKLCIKTFESKHPKDNTH